MFKCIYPIKIILYSHPKKKEGTKVLKELTDPKSLKALNSAWYVDSHAKGIFFFLLSPSLLCQQQKVGEGSGGKVPALLRDMSWVFHRSQLSAGWGELRPGCALHPPSSRVCWMNDEREKLAWENREWIGREGHLCVQYHWKQSLLLSQFC